MSMAAIETATYAQPAVPISDDAVIEALTWCREHEFPYEAVRAVLADPEPFVDHLLAELRLTPAELKAKLRDGDDFEHDYHLWTFAFYLLAQLKEPRAFALMIDFFNTPGDFAADLTGDTHTEDLPAALANTFDGNIELLKSFIENKDCNEYSRSSALETLGVLLCRGRLDEAWVRAYVGELLAKALIGDEDPFTSWLVCFALDLRAPEHRAALERCFDEERVDEMIVDRGSIERDYAKPAMDRLDAFRLRGKGFDVLADMPDWSYFRKPEPELKSQKKHPGYYVTQMRSKDSGTVIHAGPKIGRNDPCSCGSGKKYKKCCLE
jgi:hypothetical protein